MSAEPNAHSQVQAFRGWVGSPEMSDDEAHLHDLLAVDRATV